MSACLTVTLLLSCSSKEEKQLLKRYKENSVYHHFLQKTEKVQLYKEGVTKVVLTATHLQKKHYNSKDTSNEVFIVGLDVENEIALKLNSREYQIMLDGHKPLKIKHLSHFDGTLHNVPFVTTWGSYYRVEFPHIKGKVLHLNFESKVYGKGKLNFAKVAKFMLENTP